MLKRMNCYKIIKFINNYLQIIIFIWNFLLWHDPLRTKASEWVSWACRRWPSLAPPTLFLKTLSFPATPCPAPPKPPFPPSLLSPSLSLNSKYFLLSLFCVCVFHILSYWKQRSSCFLFLKITIFRVTCVWSSVLCNAWFDDGFVFVCGQCLVCVWFLIRFFLLFRCDRIRTPTCHSRLKKALDPMDWGFYPSLMYVHTVALAFFYFIYFKYSWIKCFFYWGVRVG